MKTEDEIKKRINDLEIQLKLCEELWKHGNIYNQNRARTAAFNIESQLAALYFVLDEEYVYKHK